MVRTKLNFEPCAVIQQIVWLLVRFRNLAAFLSSLSAEDDKPSSGLPILGTLSQHSLVACYSADVAWDVHMLEFGQLAHSFLFCFLVMCQVTAGWRAKIWNSEDSSIFGYHWTKSLAVASRKRDDGSLRIMANMWGIKQGDSERHPAIQCCWSFFFSFHSEILATKPCPFTFSRGLYHRRLQPMALRRDPCSLSYGDVFPQFSFAHGCLYIRILSPPPKNVAGNPYGGDSGWCSGC